jgi:hypothetical protein
VSGDGPVKPPVDCAEVAAVMLAACCCLLLLYKPANDAEVLPVFVGTLGEPTVAKPKGNLTQDTA